jgi:uncharacterized protein (TIGR00369 family)
MVRLPAYKGSFFCGPARQDGVGLELCYEKGRVLCDVRIDNRFQGYKGVVHGGIVMGMLDTLMWYVLVIETKKVCLTRHIDMDFFKPVLCNTPYRASTEFLRTDDKDVYASGRLEDASGQVCAHVTGLFRESKELSLKDVVNRMDLLDASPETKDLILSLLL